MNHLIHVHIYTFRNLLSFNEFACLSLWYAPLHLWCYLLNWRLHYLILIGPFHFLRLIFIPYFFWWETSHITTSLYVMHFFFLDWLILLAWPHVWSCSFHSSILPGVCLNAWFVDFSCSMNWENCQPLFLQIFYFCLILSPLHLRLKSYV